MASHFKGTRHEVFMGDYPVDQVDGPDGDPLGRRMDVEDYGIARGHHAECVADDG